MLKFTVADGKVKLDGIHANMQFVKQVRRKYKGELGIRVLTFVHLAARIDQNAPFFTAAPDEIEELVMRQLFTEGERAKLDVKQLWEWVEEYQKMYETPEARIVKIYNDKIDEMRQLIEDTEPEIVENIKSNGEKSYATNLKILTDLMKELGNLWEVKEKLEAKIRKQQVAGHGRAGKTPSLLEKQMLNG